MLIKQVSNKLPCVFLALLQAVVIAFCALALSQIALVGLPSKRGIVKLNTAAVLFYGLAFFLSLFGAVAVQKNVRDSAVQTSSDTIAEEKEIA